MSLFSVEGPFKGVGSSSCLISRCRALYTWSLSQLSMHHFRSPVSSFRPQWIQCSGLTEFLKACSLLLAIFTLDVIPPSVFVPLILSLTQLFGDLNCCLWSSFCFAFVSVFLCYTSPHKTAKVDFSFLNLNKIKLCNIVLNFDFLHVCSAMFIFP